MVVIVHQQHMGPRVGQHRLHRLFQLVNARQGRERKTPEDSAVGSGILVDGGIARQQEAKLFELGAAVSLSRLWRLQGKITQAYDLLAPVYQWFTEGFDIPRLQDAKVLLDQLEAER